MIVFAIIAALVLSTGAVYRVGRSLFAARRPEAASPSVTPQATAEHRTKRKSVALVVLGDIGRSPRMLYHADSFARHGFETRIVAHRGALTCLCSLPLPAQSRNAETLRLGQGRVLLNL